MSIRPIFAWYDLWVGAFWDGAKRRLYLFPLPMFGVVVQFATPPALSADFTRALPGGSMDDATFEAVETALDRVDAPCREGGRWLTLPERVAALAAKPSDERRA